MSGGRWVYRNDNACNEICNVSADYGFNKNDYYEDKVNIVRHFNPMEDRELSELVYDVFCLLHSADWYKSGDNSYNIYRADVEYFKNKWFGVTDSQRVEREINKALQTVKEELYEMFNVEVEIDV